MRFFNKLLAKTDLALIKRSRITKAEKEAKQVTSLVENLREQTTHAAHLEAAIQAEKSRAAQLTIKLQVETQKNEQLDEKITSEASRFAQLEAKLQEETAKATLLSKQLQAETQKTAQLNETIIAEAKRFAQLEEKLQVETQKVVELGDRLQAEIKTSAQLRDDIQKRTLEIQNNITPKILCNNAFDERTFYADFETNWWNNKFQTKLLRLCRNLDNDSIETVMKILCRLKSFYGTSEPDKNIFSDDEQQKLALMLHNFSKHTLKINDNLYCYKNYFLPINRIDTSVFHYEHSINYLSNMQKIRNTSIIDAGAFIGDSALMLSQLTDDKVYSFEANQENYQLLKKTIRLNSLDRVVPIKIALGAKKGKVQLYQDGIRSSCALVRSKNVATVQMDTLDNYVAKHALNIGLIKVDIEGFEQQLLKGAIKTIKAQRPTLLLSIYHTPDDFFSIKPMIESWNLGYRFQIVKPLDKNILLETLLIAETSD